MARNEGAGKDRVRRGTDGPQRAAGGHVGPARAAQHGTAHSPAAARLNLKSDLSASQLAPAPARSRSAPAPRPSVCPACVWPGLSRSWSWSWTPSVGRPSAWASAPCWCWCCGWCSCLASLAAREGALRPTFCVQYRGQFKIVRLARRIYARLKIVPARAAWPGRPVLPRLLIENCTVPS